MFKIICFFLGGLSYCLHSTHGGVWLKSCGQYVGLWFFFIISNAWYYFTKFDIVNPCKMPLIIGNIDTICSYKMTLKSPVSRQFVYRDNTLEITVCLRKGKPRKMMTNMVYIKMCFKQSTLLYISNCHIVYLSLAKHGNDFHKIVLKIWLQT